EISVGTYTFWPELVADKKLVLTAIDASFDSLTALIPIMSNCLPIFISGQSIPISNGVFCVDIISILNLLFPCTKGTDLYSLYVLLYHNKIYISGICVYYILYVFTTFCMFLLHFVCFYYIF